MVRVIALLLLLVTGAVLALVFWLQQPAPSGERQRAATLFSPYLDVNLAIEGSVPLQRSYFSATTKSIIDWAANPDMAGVQALTLSFATGECGRERWGPLDAQALAQNNLPALQAAAIGYVIATGGQHGVFTCHSPAGMEAFIQRYRSSHLVGFDFNIEAHQTQQEIRALVHQVAQAQQRHPDLRWSFTLATGAGQSDQGLNATGQWVMRAILEERFTQAHINLMVMNFGAASSSVCVVRDDRCDMVASAQQAVALFQRRYQWPSAQLGVTPMIGVNDVTSNVFHLEDARRLAEYVRAQGLGALHFWSLNRDTACAPAQHGSASAVCHGLSQLRDLAFTQTFAQALQP